PLHTCVRAVAFFPAQGLVEAIASHLDISWDHLVNGGLGAAEHHILPSTFQIVVDDREGARTVPTGDRLGIRTHFLEVREVRVDHRRVPRVQGHSPTRPYHRVSVNVASVEYQMMGKLVDARLRATKHHQIGEEYALPGHSGVTAQD